MSKLINNIEVLPFEARKDAAHVFNNLIRKNLSNFAHYVLENFEIVTKLIEGVFDTWIDLIDQNVA